MEKEKIEYLGAFVRIKSDFNLSELIDDSKVHQDRLKQIDMSDWIGKPSDEYICIGNHFDATKFDINFNGCVYALFGQGQEVAMQEKITFFRNFYKETIEFLELKIGKQNIDIMFGYISYEIPY